MKKSILFTTTLLALSVMGLASCSCSKTPSGNSESKNSGNTSQNGGTSQNVPGGEEVAPGTEVTVYLNLGAVGRYKGQKGQDIPEKFLENAVVFTGKAGQDSLPGASDVTATSGATFVSWVYYAGGGAPVAFDKVPCYKDLILLANFSGGNGTITSESGGGGNTSIPEGQVTYTITGIPNWAGNDNAVLLVYAWGGAQAAAWYDMDWTSGSATGTVTLPSDRTGMKVVRLPAGTTTATANFDNAYNQSSSDITLSSGTTSYACGF